jgi:protein SCO1/2
MAIVGFSFPVCLGLICSPLHCTQGRGVGGEGFKHQCYATKHPSPQPLSPEYRGEGPLKQPLGDVADASRLALIKKAPEFTLTTQDGGTLRLADLKDKVLLVSFIFTTCNGTCPATTHRMAQVQQELKTRGFSKHDAVHLLSITLDPARDTPEILRGYLRLYDLDSSNWSFLTGAAPEVARTTKAWGMWARLAANGQLDHPSRIFLVDRQGWIREIYNLSFLKPKWVAEDVELLLGEKPSVKR